MSATVIVLIVIGLVAILAALYMARRSQAARKREDQRVIANEHREEAERHRLTAAREKAVADEQAAAARRQAAEAEQRAHDARMAQITADAHSEHAQELDPDDASDSQKNLAERREVFDGERDGLSTEERPPASEPELARREA